MTTDPAIYDVGTPQDQAEALHEDWLDKVCHEAQMHIWSGELLGALSEYIRDDILSDDVVHMHSVTQDEIRRILSAATTR